MVDQKRHVSELRARLGDVDRELCSRLEERVKLSRQIRDLVEPESGAADIGDVAWLEALLSGADGDLSPEVLRAIFSQIRAAARTSKPPVAVACFGAEGTFCQQAAREFFGVAAQLHELSSAADALDEVKRERAGFAVLPLESTSEGVLQVNVLALARTSLVMVGQSEVRANHDLVTATSKFDELQVVYVTPASYLACGGFIHRELSSLRVEYVRTVAAALEQLHREPASAAIVPIASTENAEFTTLRANVGDVSDARLRFTIVGSRPPVRSGRDLTCLLFSISDRPGSLHDVLRHFAERNVNLKRMQAFPVREETFDYLFYVEIDGHLTDRSLVTALENVKRATRYFRVLGSFPA